MGFISNKNGKRFLENYKTKHVHKCLKRQDNKWGTWISCMWPWMFAWMGCNINIILSCRKGMRCFVSYCEEAKKVKNRCRCYHTTTSALKKLCISLLCHCTVFSTRCWFIVMCHLKFLLFNKQCKILCNSPHVCVRGERKVLEVIASSQHVSFYMFLEEKRAWNRRSGCVSNISGGAIVQLAE